MQYIDLGNTKKQPTNKKKWLKLLAIPALIAATVLILVISPLSFSFSDLLAPVSVFSQVVNPKQLSSTDGRTNILLLAVDDREEIDPRCGDDAGSGSLTDTIILASLGKKDKDIVLLSLPRDLWVETGYYSGKINAAYAYGGSSSNGAEFVSRIVGGVTGVPIHYYAVVNFLGFEQAIDILGGIEIDVERGFDDYRYPIPGQECAENEEERWEHIHFDEGLQTMDGARALKFVRSRHAEGPEGSDFARSRRQQKVLLAAKRKFFSLSAFSDWARVKNLYQTFEDHVRTDLGIWELERLYHWAREAETIPIKMEVLDGAQGLLVATQDENKYKGAWVLAPIAGDYSQVRNYVQTLLFESGN
ncbi:MAG: LCP family protein [Patescibacteria group bacterium]|nr:LCP family protein [Patescibacteria group bacterium]